MAKAKPDEATQESSAVATKEKPKFLFVRAVGQIGVYGGERKYPLNWPGQKNVPHGRAGRPFWIRAHEFSDSKRSGNFKTGEPIPPGWMELIDPQPPQPVAIAQNVTVVYEPAPVDPRGRYKRASDTEVV